MLADVNHKCPEEATRKWGLLVFTYDRNTIIVDMCLLVEFLLEFCVFLDRSRIVLGTSLGMKPTRSTAWEQRTGLLPGGGRSG